MPIRILTRRGSATEWTNANPTLAAGEMGLDSTINRFKVGNGTSAWNDLGYVNYVNDFAARFVGTPLASRILAEWVVDRKTILSTDGTSETGWQFWCVNRPASTTTNLLVKKNGSTIAIYQFTTSSVLVNSRYRGTLSGVITSTTLNVGDFLTVETDTSVDALFSTPIFTIQGIA